MSELDKSKLKAAMKNAGLSMRELSLAVGTNDSLVKNMLGGKSSNPRMDSLQKISERLGYPAAHFIKGAGVDAPPPSPPAKKSRTKVVPVISWVAAGRLAEPDTELPDETETIEISGLPAGDYFGTRARGDSMNRIAPDGALIIVNRAERELVRGRRYIFAHKGRTTFKRYGVDPVRLEPESLNPDNDPIFPKEGESWDVIGRVRLVVAEI